MSTARRRALFPSIAWLAGIMLAATIVPAAGDQQSCDPAMLVFDASGSMKGSRIVDARNAAATVMPSLAGRRPVGLVTYGGHDRTEAARNDRCGSIDLRLLPQPDAGGLILSEIGGLQPNGSTPLTDAVRLAAEQLSAFARSGVVVLVTDGEENCGGDPCALGRQIAVSGLRLKVFVIGFRLRIAAGDALACLARETEGTYVEVRDARSLERALESTLGCLAVSRREIRPPGDRAIASIGASGPHW